MNLYKYVALIASERENKYGLGRLSGSPELVEI